MVQNEETEINGNDRANEGEKAAEAVSDSMESQEEITQDATDENKSSDPVKEILTKKDVELKEWMDRTQRLAAEYDNFRKRTQKEKEKIYTDAISDVVAKFLPIADNLERALKAAENEENGGLKEGVTLVFRQISDIFDKLDVKPIEAVGATFNPEYHNAVMHVEDEAYEHNIVVEEFQKGYIYKNEIVIRHSMVKVAN